MKDMEKELRKVFDSMPLDQLCEEFQTMEIQPLSKTSEQRIKNLVKEKMKTENIQLSKKSKGGAKKWAAVAAACALVVTGVAAYNADDVKADLIRLFGFVPGMGVVQVENEQSKVVENVTIDPGAEHTQEMVMQALNWYLLENTDAKAEDDMIRIELKDAIVMGDELQVRYAVRLLKLTNQDISDAFAALDGGSEDALMEMYRKHGYEKYFALDDAASLRLVPHSSMSFNGKEVLADSVSIGGSETTDGAGIVCVTEKYKIGDLLTEDQPSGTLHVAGVNLDFRMKNLDLGASMEEVTQNSLVEEACGMKIMCIPKWENDMLYVDFYTIDSGDYSYVHGFFQFYSPAAVMTVNGKELENVGDESYYFENEKTSFIGRYAYDLTSVDGEVTTAQMKTLGLLVNQSLTDKKIEFTSSPETEMKIQEVLELDSSTVTFEKISNQPCESVDDYDYSEYGYLVLNHKVDERNPKKEFMFFDDIYINGEKIDGYSIASADDVSYDMRISLPIPYSEVRSIEFGTAQYQLNEEMQFDLLQGK